MNLNYFIDKTVMSDDIHQLGRDLGYESVGKQFRIIDFEDTSNLIKLNFKWLLKMTLLNRNISIMYKTIRCYSFLNRYFDKYFCPFFNRLFHMTSYFHFYSFFSIYCFARQWKIHPKKLSKIWMETKGWYSYYQAKRIMPLFFITFVW